MNDLNPELLISEAREWLKLGDIDLISEEFILGLIVALEATKPRTVATLEELDALPNGSVIKDKFGDVLESRGGFWCGYETTPLTTNHVGRKYLPATIIYIPEAPSD